jgi:hypothetical protein
MMGDKPRTGAILPGLSSGFTGFVIGKTAILPGLSSGIRLLLTDSNRNLTAPGSRLKRPPGWKNLREIISVYLLPGTSYFKKHRAAP